MTLQVLLRYRTRRPWAPAPATLRSWARLAAGSRRGELGIRVVGSAESGALNLQYRGKRTPTNVLSFPMPAGAGRSHGIIGDVVVCAPLVAREARDQGKTLRAHWAHMVIHGSLHLLGFDHERATDARRMERRERELLAQLGFGDPYGD